MENKKECACVAYRDAVKSENTDGGLLVQCSCGAKFRMSTKDTRFILEKTKVYSGRISLEPRGENGRTTK